jgi:hypothetical protein
VCGQQGDNITVIDTLTGTLDGCFYANVSYEQLVADPSQEMQCSGLLFGNPCGSFAGNLDIVIYPGGPSVIPSTRDYLSTLGLADVNLVGGNVRVIVTGLQGLGTIAPDVFTGLVAVEGSFSVVDDAVPPAITSIGGLTSLAQVIPPH